MTSIIISHFHPEITLGIVQVGNGALWVTPGMKNYTAVGYGSL
jgi:hypothetical protein